MSLVDEHGANPEIIPVRKYELLTWTEDEQVFRNRAINRDRGLIEILVPFAKALQVKLRRSIFGTYLKFLNETKAQNGFLNENKLGITDCIIKNFETAQTKRLDYNNNLFDDTLVLLKSAVLRNEVVDLDFLHDNLILLRLDDFNVNEIDCDLLKFRKLCYLALCANWLGDIKGSSLPRRLKFLELYSNDLTNIENLTKNPPKNLQHLGLGRNKLTNNSSFHLLGINGSFLKLRTLDLSHGDIYRLVEALESLKQLQWLEGLSLQGNPCSVVMAYKNTVLSYFPNLIFLDDTELANEDRQFPENYADGATSAELIFTCPKLTGLPSPPKVKTAKQTIHLEFFVPLFQDIEELKKIEEGSDEVKPKTKAKGDKKGGKESVKNKKGGGKNKKSSVKSSKKRSPYALPEERPPEVNYYFQTERKVWAKSMRFSPVVLKSPENNLNAFRDTFRSCVNVRVIYLKVLIPKRKGKREKGKKDKKKKTTEKEKSGRSSKGKKQKGKLENEKSDKSSSSKKNKLDKREKRVEEPKEVVLKRIKLAEFCCNLYHINWKDANLEFHWCDDPKLGDKALEFIDFLTALKSEEKIVSPKKNKKEDTKKEGKGKKEKRSNKIAKSKKTRSSKKSKKSSKKSKKIKSESLTCQVNFGLTRM